MSTESMKSSHEIRERLIQLQSSQKNGVKNESRIDFLKTMLSEKPYTKVEIKEMAVKAINEENYADISLYTWTLEDSINSGR